LRVRFVNVFAPRATAVNLRRLERLERFKIVSRRPDGTWLVPPNLLAILRDRERTHPRLRVVVESPRIEPRLDRHSGPSRRR